jgi:four helix bundle protein
MPVTHVTEGSNPFVPVFLPLGEKRREEKGDSRKLRKPFSERSTFASLLSILENQMSFIFEKLVVYQEAVNLAEKINKLTEAFSRGSYYLSDQLNRAVTSIALNIAEGNGRFHKNDRNNFFYIARGSVHECVPLIELVYRKGLMLIEAKKELSEKLETIAKMISGLIK